MQENGSPQAGEFMVLHCLQTLPWSAANEAQNPEELPPMIRLSLEASMNVENDAKSTDEFALLDSRTAEIMTQFKDSLTASQFEQLRIWYQVNQDNMSRRYEGIYLAGARVGIKFAKQCKSIG
ncbi:hypothetical protein [Paenibacillus sp. EPM92]|uniref:hypothetical protein n=1 Tax=Paenibacillus sp. EPM92 TaxID=1561195 RepID=UPI001916668E|nr:hypothetical protein [Paenibacillus sp. EPM92]